MSAGAALDPSIVCFGDRIILASAYYLGYLHSQPLKGDGSPPRLIIDEQRNTGPTKIDMVETAVLEIMKPTQSSSVSLVYGQRVKLRHVYSDLVFSLLPMGFLRLEERLEQQSHQLFKILPKYSKIRVEGEYVRDCDQVIFQHVDSGSVLTALRSGGSVCLDAPVRKVPFSREMRQDEEMWTLQLFHKEALGQTPVKLDAPEEPKPIKVGSIVSLQHVESDRFVTYKPLGIDKPEWLPELPMGLPAWDRPSREQYCAEERYDAAMEFSSYSSLWVIESSEVTKGGLVTLHKQHSKDPAFYFRIRHLQTGRYLAVQETGNGNMELTTLPYHKSRVVRFLPDSRYGDCGNTVISGHTLVRVVFDTPRKVFLHVRRKNNILNLSNAMIYDDLFVMRPVGECGRYYGELSAAASALRNFTGLPPDLSRYDYSDLKETVDEWCDVLRGVRDRTQKFITSHAASKELDVMHRQSLLLDCSIHTLCFVTLLWCKVIEDESYEDLVFCQAKVTELRRHCYTVLAQLCFRPYKPKLRGSRAAAALSQWIPFMCYLIGNNNDDAQGLKLVMDIIKDRPRVVESISRDQTELGLQHLLPLMASSNYDTRRMAFLSCLCVCNGKGAFAHHQGFICDLLKRDQHPLLFPTQWREGKIWVKPHSKRDEVTLDFLMEDPEDSRAVAYLAATRELLFALAYRNSGCASYVRTCVGTDEMLEGVVLCEREQDFDIDPEPDSDFGCFDKQWYPANTYLDPLRSSYVRLGRAAYIDDAPDPPRYQRRRAVTAPGSSHDDVTDELTKHPKLPDTVQILSDLLRSCPLLCCMAGTSLHAVIGEIVEHAAPVTFGKGMPIYDREACLWLITSGEVVLADGKTSTKAVAPLYFGEKSMVVAVGEESCEECTAATPVCGYRISIPAVYKILQECARSGPSLSEVSFTDLPECDPVVSDVWPWHRFVLVRGLMTALEDFLAENRQLCVNNAARNVLLTEWLQLLSRFLELDLYNKTAFAKHRLSKMLPLLASILDLETDDTTTDFSNPSVHYPHPLADNPAKDLSDSLHSPFSAISAASRTDSQSKLERWSLVRSALSKRATTGGAPLSPRSSHRAMSPRGRNSMSHSLRSSHRAMSPRGRNSIGGHGSLVGSPRMVVSSSREFDIFADDSERPSVEQGIMTGVKLQLCRIFVKLLEGADVSCDMDEGLVEKLKAILLGIMRLKASRELFITSFRLYLKLHAGAEAGAEIPERLVDQLRDDLVNTDDWRLMKTGTTGEDSETARDSLLSRMVDHCTSFNHCGVPGVSHEEENEVIGACLMSLERMLTAKSSPETYGSLSERQNMLKGLGGIDIIINTVDTAATTAAQEEVVKKGLYFAISLLEGGNKAIQDGLKQYFFSRSDETLFLVLRDRITEATSTVEDDNLPSDFEGPLFHIEETMRFLQLCCEGHNTALQNYFRVQEDNVQSHDLVTETLKFLTSLFSLTTMSTFCLQIGIQTWRTLTEFCQGPVTGNQQALIEGGIGEDVNHMFSMELDSEGLVVEAQNEAIVCLLSVIEGCTKPNAPLILRDALDTQLLLKSLEGIPEDEREEVELGFNIFLLLSFLREYDTYDNLDFATKLNPRAQRGRLGEALEFYSLRTARVEIMRETGIESVYFRKPSVSLLLSKKSRKHVMEHICWDTRQSRLVDFFDRVEQTVYELNLIGHTQQSPNSRVRNAVHKWSAKSRWGGHALVMICNVLLFFYDRREEGFVDWVLSLMTLALMALVCIGFLEFVWFEGPVLTFAKDRERKRKQGYSVADYITRSPSIDTAVDNLSWQEMGNTSLPAVIKESWTEPPFLRLLLSLAACSLSLCLTPFFLSILLIPLITESPVIRHVFRAVTRNGKSLFLTMVFGIILMYLFAVVGFMLFDDMFEQKNACTSMATCFAHIVNYGLRAGGGVGELIEAPDWNSHLYGVRVTYDMLFYIIINVILMNIVFGIIVDTFGELRQQREKTEIEMRTSCFICDVVYSEFDKRADGFGKHIARDHNLWDYMFFVFYLATKVREDLTGQESYVFNCLAKNNFRFVPFKTSLCFEQETFDETHEKAESEKSEGGFKDFEGLEMLGKLEAIEKVSAQCKTLEEHLTTLARDVRQGLTKIDTIGGPKAEPDFFPRQDTQTMYGTMQRPPCSPVVDETHLMPRGPSKPLSSPTVPFVDSRLSNLSFQQPVHSGFNQSFIGMPEYTESPDNTVKYDDPQDAADDAVAGALCVLAACVDTSRKAPLGMRQYKFGMQLEPLLTIDPPSQPGSAAATPVDTSLRPPRPLIPKLSLNESDFIPTCDTVLSDPTSATSTVSAELSMSVGAKQGELDLEATRAEATLEAIKSEISNNVMMRMQCIKEIDTKQSEAEKKFDDIIGELRTIRSQKQSHLSTALAAPPAPLHRTQPAIDFRITDKPTAIVAPMGQLSEGTYPRCFAKKVAPAALCTPQSPQSPPLNPISGLLSRGRGSKARNRTDRAL